MEKQRRKNLGQSIQKIKEIIDLEFAIINYFYGESNKTLIFDCCYAGATGNDGYFREKPVTGK